MTQSTLHQFALALAIAATALPMHAATEAPGRVSEVTLYRGQAQVTRIVPVEAAAGRMELVVGNLPEQVAANSLFAEGGEALEIRAVRYRTRAVGEEPREEVRALDEQIRDTQAQLDLTQKQQALLAKRTEYLGKLEGFVAPTAHADLSQGVLDAEALERITTFAFAQHEKIAADEVSLAKTARDLTEQLELLNRQRAELTAGAAKTLREAVVFIQKNGDGPAELRLTYLVNNCGWSPSYTMRAAADRKQVRVEYNALIHQLTGEDWTDVELTLSTASPAISAAGPGLAPFHVTLSADPGQTPAQTEAGKPTGNVFGRGLSKGEIVDQLAGLNSQRLDYSNAMVNSTNWGDVTNSSWNLNIVAFRCAELEINGDATTLSVLRTENPAEQNGPSLSYRLGGNVSLASRSDQQMVRVMASELASKFYHIAVPVLTSFVYREAELVNTSDEDMLAGPMTAYLDGRFVGQGEIPTVARGQSFVVGFGADPQLRARRELVDRQDSLQGGNRETQFKYRLVLENFNSEPTAVRLMERLPHADNGADIEITLGETSDPLSEDKLYQREELPMGILRWDVEAPASAAGETARVVQYEYTAEYDRKFVVATASQQQRQEEFEQLQRERQKR
jgi:hypothetical protein